MDSIEDYIEAAKSRQGITADWKLCFVIGVSPSMIAQWRSSKCLPSDSRMLELAALADADPSLALAHLNLWRARDPSVTKAYRAIIQRLGAACVAIMLLMVGSASVQARTGGEQTDTRDRPSVYYQKYE